jgi:hypothetical protein
MPTDEHARLTTSCRCDVVVERVMVTHRTGVNGRLTCARGHEMVTMPCTTRCVKRVFCPAGRKTRFQAAVVGLCGARSESGQSTRCALTDDFPSTCVRAHGAGPTSQWKVIVARSVRSASPMAAIGEVSQLGAARPLRQHQQSHRVEASGPALRSMMCVFRMRRPS